MDKIKELIKQGKELNKEIKVVIKEFEDKIYSVIEKIKELPNRDDKICCTGSVKMGILDGGGVGRFEVIKMLEEILKWSL